MSAAVPMPPQAQQRWARGLGLLGLLVAALLVLYRDTALGMASIWWRSETFTHAFTVPLISLWLVWRRRAQLAALTPRPVPWLLLPMALVALAWLAGHLVSVNAITQFALVTLLVLCVPAALGWQVADAIRFPLLFLYFAVPFGEFLMPQLMDWTADFTVWALQRTGIPVLREGLQFTIPSGHWSVEAACSGIRYLMASLMVGVLFAYLNYSSMLRRWLFVGVSALVPIVANWVRAYLIVLIGHLSGNELATGADHLVYGWLFFGLVIVVMLSIGAAWSQPEAGAAAPASAAPPCSAALPAATLALLAAAALAVLALPHLLLAQVASVSRPSLVNLAAVGTPAAGWHLDAQAPADWHHAYLNPTLRLERNYVQGARRVGLQLAYYAAETSDSKLVSSTNALAQGRRDGWARVSQGQHVQQRSGAAITWRTAELRSGLADGSEGTATRLVVWQVYWINGVLTASDYQAKALLALNRLLGRGGDGAVLWLYTRRGAPGQAEAALEAFARDNLDTFDEQLRRARDAAR